MKLTRPILLAATVAIAVLGAATAVVVAHAGAKKTEINVTEKEFRITLSSHKATAGPVRFVVKNTGAYPHALAISGAGVKLKKTAIISPGKSTTLIVHLRSGRYSLWCPVPGHAAKGMKATLTLPGASAGTTSTTDTTTPIPGY